MHFIEVEQSVENVAWAMPDLHSHRHYELYFLESGERNFYLGGNLYQVKANTAVLVPPYVMHKTEGGPFSRINVDFTDDFFDETEKSLLEDLGETAVFPLNAENGAAFSKVLTAFLSTNGSPKVAAVAATLCVKTLIGLLFLFRTELHEVEKVSGNGSISPLTLKIVGYINKNCKKKLTITSLAEQFNVSESCLAKSFKNQTGYNVGEFIINARINEAKQLLDLGRLSVNDIAMELGFSSPNYFGMVFKQKVGVSPINYKKWLKT